MHALPVCAKVNSMPAWAFSQSACTSANVLGAWHAAVVCSRPLVLAAQQSCLPHDPLAAVLWWRLCAAAALLTKVSLLVCTSGSPIVLHQMPCKGLFKRSKHKLEAAVSIPCTVIALATASLPPHAAACAGASALLSETGEAQTTSCWGWVFTEPGAAYHMAKQVGGSASAAALSIDHVRHTCLG